MWRAFRHPATPLHLKLLTLLVPLYLVSPIDIIPDFLIGLGFIDDLIIVPLLVGWIVKMLPPEVRGEPVRNAAGRRPYDDIRSYRSGTVIEGSARRR